MPVFVLYRAAAEENSLARSELTHKLEFEALTAKEGWRKETAYRFVFGRP
jgi:hypothetical protein